MTLNEFMNVLRSDTNEIWLTTGDSYIRIAEYNYKLVQDESMFGNISIDDILVENDGEITITLDISEKLFNDIGYKIDEMV